MKISLDWLRDFVEIDESPQTVADALTRIGLEVEGMQTYESVRGGLKGVVVGKVENVAAHPNADRLRVCTVNVGSERRLNIVCGAPNVAEGQNVPVALVGTTIYPVEGEPITLKRAKIRGVESEGMICAPDELGLQANHDGILVLNGNWAPGTPAAEALNVHSDVIFDVGITPNRGDALSHYGTARDLAALWNRELKRPTEIVRFSQKHPCPVKVEIKDRTRCPRYSSAVVEGVRVGVTPEKYRRRLEAVGQRSVNSVVDAANYVMMEIGQPLHVFDRDKIRGGCVVVSTCAETTEFKRLDGKTTVLGPEDLVIADAGGPICIAGVIGGANSAVDENTRNLFIESAYFLPSAIRKTARRTQIHTETTYRFERGGNPKITLFALARVVKLILDWSGGRFIGASDQKFDEFKPKIVRFSFERVRRLVGDPNIEASEFVAVMRRLRIGCRLLDSDKIVARVPRYRTDVGECQDLCEEFVRIRGFDDLPARRAFTLYPAPANPIYDYRHRLGDYLAADGFREIRTNSLIPTRKKEQDSAAVINAVSEDHAVLRKSLVYTSLEVLAYNLNRKAVAPKFFEIGKIYRKNEKVFEEETVLGLLVAGATGREHWKVPARETDFFTLKRAVERLFALTGAWVRYEPFTDEDEWAYGMRCLSRSGELLGKFGALCERALAEHDLRLDVFFAQIRLDALGTGENPIYREIPKYPSVRRDLSLFVEGASYREIENMVRSAHPKWIKEVNLFDVYRPKDGGRVAYALSLIMWDENKTLSDTDADNVVRRAIETLEKDGRIEVRKG
ncbi:MAG: phenylalanine--tRNA ligase subunit beta [Bacteroidia bacterium]|nr:phenylalanine--tRNA ligase subunit beta [Bacteroidia bacterium]